MVVGDALYTGIDGAQTGIERESDGNRTGISGSCSSNLNVTVVKITITVMATRVEDGRLQ